MTPPKRHWRPWTNRSPRFMHGHERMFNEVHSTQRGMLIRDILDKMRHDGCGGRAGKAELLTGIEGVSSRPVRRIVLREG